MTFNTEEYYLYIFKDEDCYDDDSSLYFDQGYTLAYCEKFTRDYVHLKVLTWKFGILDWIEMSFLEGSPDSEKFFAMDNESKLLLFQAVFSGEYDGNGSDQFGFIFNHQEDD